MEYLNIGRYVNTHGIKGEIRLLSNFRYKDNVFKPGFKFYIGSEKKEYEVESYRHHKNFDMFIFKNIHDINLIEHLKGSMVYINKEDLILDKNEYLAIDLIGFNVIIDDKLVGKVTDVIDTPANEVLRINNDILVPYVKEFILDIDINNKKIIINNVRGLIS